MTYPHVCLSSAIPCPNDLPLSTNTENVVPLRVFTPEDRKVLDTLTQRERRIVELVLRSRPLVTAREALEMLRKSGNAI